MPKKNNGNKNQNGMTKKGFLHEKKSINIIKKYSNFITRQGKLV